MKTHSKHKAFTLIELLVVIGLIAVLAGGIGVAMLQGDGGRALESSQGSFISMISGARAQAALKNTNAIVVVDSDPLSDGFMRTFYIATLEDSNRNGYWDTGENWNGDSTPVTLPRNVFFVPAKSMFASNLTFAPTWPNSKTSTGFVGTTVTVSNIAGTFKLLRVFTPSGKTQDETNGNKFVFAIGNRQSDTIVNFDNEFAVRGAKISQYGVLTFINDSGNF